MIKLMILISMIASFVIYASYIFPNWIDNLILLIELFSIFLILILYIKKRKYSPIIIVITLFEVLYLISSVINKNYTTLINSLKTTMAIISLSALTDMELKINAKKMITALCVVMSIISIVCIITMLKYYPNGMYCDNLNDCNYYFLGQDNGSFFDIFPSVIFVIILSLIKHNKISKFSFVYTLFIFYGFYYVNSVSSYIIMLLLIIYMLTYKSKIWEKILTPKNITLITTILFVVVVVIGIANIPILSKFVTERLGKSVTLTGRTGLWSKGIEYIKKSPLYGYGFEDGILLKQKFGISHLHNFILQILYNGGIISLITFLYMNYICLQKIRKYEKTYIGRTLIISLLFIYILSMFDYYNYKIFIYVIYIFIFNVEYIINSSKKVKADEK